MSKPSANETDEMKSSTTHLSKLPPPKKIRIGNYQSHNDINNINDSNNNTNEPSNDEINKDATEQINPLKQKAIYFQLSLHKIIGYTQY